MRSSKKAAANSKQPTPPAANDMSPPKHTKTKGTASHSQNTRPAASATKLKKATGTQATVPKMRQPAAKKSSTHNRTSAITSKHGEIESAAKREYQFLAKGFHLMLISSGNVKSLALGKSVSEKNKGV